jgi:hypothetical protein
MGNKVWIVYSEVYAEPFPEIHKIFSNAESSYGYIDEMRLSFKSYNFWVKEEEVSD